VLKRVFDFLLALIVLACLMVPIIALALLVRLTSTGPVLYWSVRVGRKNTFFNMPKFRTMRVGAPSVATHLLQDPKK
jgi:O-antigen biosynthesis protein WbqP